MVNIEIDGKHLEAREGAMIIEAADDAGIYIPRFCYHKKLSIAANCRMCLIEVEKVGKSLPACATPITDGMKINTRSAKAIDAQKSVMEFLLINHPLDCPICDQGGECELQDVAMGYGGDVSVYAEKKRVVMNKDFGPLITGDMTRCIHCTRCVRFGEEIAGIKEMGGIGRGEHMEIGTYVQLSISSEMSGNIIDLCPVGALTAKPSRFSARAWEMEQRESIAAHDCMGSNVLIHTFRNQVVRVVPNENEEINETWLSDRDRFSYEGLSSKERITSPMVKEDGQWKEVDWDVALHKVVGGISKLLTDDGVDKLGAISSPNATTEEQYLLQKLMREIGTGNVDHRINQLDFTGQDAEPVFPWLGQSIPDLQNNKALLLIGSNVRGDQPIAGHRIRIAAQHGAKVMSVNQVDYDFNFPLTAKKIVSPSKLLGELSLVLKAACTLSKTDMPAGLDSLMKGLVVDATHEVIARELFETDNAVVLLGHDAFSHPHFSGLRALATQIAKVTSSKMSYLSDGCNSAGASLAGATPHRSVAGGKADIKGKNLSEMFDGDLAGYFLLGVEPEDDCADAGRAIAALKAAKFVVSMNAFCTDTMKDYADVILPITPFTETSGTFVNAEGLWQSFEGVVEPLAEARPGWKLLRVLGNVFECDGFDYVSSQEVRDELKALVVAILPSSEAYSNDMNWQCPKTLTIDLSGTESGIESIADRSMYSGDGLVRRASSLQEITKAGQLAIRVNQSVASNAGLTEGEQALAKKNDIEVTLPVVIDDRVPDDSVLLPGILGAVAGAQNRHSGAVTLSRV
ncbi:MAG: NADH-quinone oxidoreductase subunit G [Ectothiorhodospiraceae bacterium]|nr:NADH-quinone oxidoreductase subunit G [Ectothiorhodospiraceae bacterium]